MQRRRNNLLDCSLVRRAQTAIGAIGLLALVDPAVAEAQAPVGVFAVRVNGGPVHSVQCFATPGTDSNGVLFKGAASDPSGQWEASWEYTADLDPTGTAKLVGAATVKNKGSGKSDFDLSFEVPICPSIGSGAKMGGSCTLKLVTNENGGVLSTPGGSAVLGALVDGSIGPKVFHGPFNMGSTGSGTAQTTNAFGAPFPGHNVGAINEDFGVRHLFGLTDGDAVVLTTNLVVGGDATNFVACKQDAPAVTPPTASAAPVPASPAPTVPSSGPAAAPNGTSTSTVVLGEDGSKKITISAASGKSGKTAKKPPSKSSNKKATSGSTKKPTSGNGKKSSGSAPRR